MSIGKILNIKVEFDLIDIMGILVCAFFAGRVLG